jgi:hypothetical protein
MPSPDPYLVEAHQALPRLLAMFDVDPFSPSRGMGDRFYWQWKLIDFANGSIQGAAYGLAQLVAHDLLPDGFAPDAALRRIDACFEGVARLRQPNGSLEEAFPLEGSFCVTAQAAFDLLGALDTLGAGVGAEKRAAWLEVVRPLIGFLHEEDETHALISNHLAAAAAALYSWHALTGEPGAERGQLFLDRIVKAQSPEGWLPEYDGADPGYQTLCLGYLAELHRMRPDLGLAEVLKRAITFVSYCAHPDGSFGGLYGSRNTRLYYPAGIEAVASQYPEARALADHMRSAIARQATVTLAAMDAPNLVPTFNAYCRAAALRAQYNPSTGTRVDPVPALAAGSSRQQYPHAGLLFDKGPAHYTIVALHKGGLLLHFAEGRPPRVDAGIVARSPDGRLYSTQGICRDNAWNLDGDRLIVTAELTLLRHHLPGPWQFILLRLLAVTVLRWRPLRHLFKQMLVRRLITDRRGSGVHNRREITLGAKVNVNDGWADGARGLRHVPLHAPFSVIHMASQGYWQRQDDAS